MIRTIKLSILTFLVTVVISSGLRATEGMWIPALLKAVEGDMQSMGLRLTAEDIYSVNKGSLKDAIVHFGGGCTSSIISDQGLLLTNHHCGYSQIQSHSSVENDILTNGFWAKSFSEELPNPGLTATMIVRIEDVTLQMREGLTENMSEDAQAEVYQRNRSRVEKEASGDTGYSAQVKAFDYGNQFFVIVTRTFEDVRLVGAPPSAIGKFGGDTDNWVWPRHTGDFSLFRIYAGPDNGPAAYSEENKPFQPQRHLSINLDGVADGDFTMVFGFPGSTSVYLTSYAVDYIQNRSNPMRIDMRRNSLSLIDAARLADDEVRIQYASKQARIANAYKKWIGQNFGLKRKRAIELKQADEAILRKNPEYAALLDKFSSLYTELNDAQFSRELFIEYYYYGPEVLRFAERFLAVYENWEEMEEKGELDAAVAKIESGVPDYFDDYNRGLDMKLFSKMSERYQHYALDGMKANSLQTSKKLPSYDRFADKWYGKSVLTSESDVNLLLSMSTGKMVKKLGKDPLFRLMLELRENYLNSIRATYSEKKREEEELMKEYVEALRKTFPERTFWPDANSTLRLTYGKAEGSAPRDGMVYVYKTTAEGILEKYDPENPDFVMPQRLIDLLEKEDYGQWTDADGNLPVCFTGSNHTTGGNSGSPTLNGNGELVGLNFDRTWESTMSDITFDPEICRNIMVDMRYVLWVIERYAEADNIIGELSLVRNKVEKPEMDDVPQDLPLDRTE